MHNLTTAIIIRSVFSTDYSDFLDMCIIKVFVHFLVPSIIIILRAQKPNFLLYKVAGSHISGMLIHC